jgi:secreted trypsin-like serine protease
MRRFVVSGATALVLAVGCSAPAPPAEATALASSAIQGGQDDPADDYAVAVFLELTSSSGDLCSGVLLAPNLVATARHCVQQPSSDVVDCASTSFGTLYDPGQIIVSNDAVLGATLAGHSVAKIIVPTDPGDESLCGHDIALLILNGAIQASQYVEPAIVPALTDHSTWATSVAAIGYGLDSPLDEAGTSAGTRRIRQDIGIVCIPDDSTFTNCYADPSVQSRVAAAEFESGDGTCEGDSGSGAFDQTQYTAGNAVAFGVLSRGGGDPGSATCTGSVYSRFDAWGGLLVSAANEAAQMGNYPVPAWATQQAAASDWGVDGSVPAATASSGGKGGGCSVAMATAPGTPSEPGERVPWRAAAPALAVVATVLMRRRSRGRCRSR